MERETKIGMVLAIAFIGLVGAVLYHKMQNPEPLYAANSPWLVQSTHTESTEPVSSAPTIARSPVPVPEQTAPMKATEEPPPTQPPITPVMASLQAPVSMPSAPTPQPPQVIVQQQPRENWLLFWKRAETVQKPAPVAIVEPPPPAPPIAPGFAPPAAPVAKAPDKKWYQFWKRDPKRPTQNVGITFDQVARSPEPPARDSGPPMPPTAPPVLEIPGGMSTPKVKNELNPPTPPGPPISPRIVEEKPVAAAPPVRPQDSVPRPQENPLSPGSLVPTGPPASAPEIVRNEPPPALLPPQISPARVEPQPPVMATPVAQRKEAAPQPTAPSRINPLPPDNTYDRRMPAKEMRENVGQPVILREQPDLPPAREGIPVVTRPGSTMFVKEYPRPRIEVKTTEIRTYTPHSNETYTLISRQLYGHEKYEAALAQFNRDRDPKLAVITVGQRIYYPEKEYLESKYPQLIAGKEGQAAPQSPLDARGPTSRYVPPGEIAPAEARITQVPVQDGKKPKAAGPAVSGLRYRVRANDSLYEIAKLTLGNGERWTEIYKLNAGVVPDPSKLELGLLLTLPKDARVDAKDKPE